MNVIKKDFISKQKRLNFRTDKCLKTNSLGRHSVLNKAPFFFQTILARGENNSLHLFNSSASVSRTFNSSDESKSNSERTQEESTGVGTSSRTSENATYGAVYRTQAESDVNTAAEFERLMTSFRSAHQSDSGETYSVGTITDRIKLNQTALTSMKHHSPSTSNSSDSEDISLMDYQRFSANEFNDEDKSQESTVFWSPKTPTGHRSAPSRSKSSSYLSSSYSVSPSKCQMGSSKSKNSKSPRTPGTGRITTSDNNNDAYILAVTEGRGQARGEVGIAAMDPRRPHLILCQISDSQRYIHTMTKMNVFSFMEVIIPNTFIEGASLSKLYIDIREQFPGVTITSVQRRHFNEMAGIDFINQYGSPECESVMVLLRDKFYALSAASALIKYVEFTQNIIFAPRSVKVEYQGTEDTMIIDLETANKLELVVSSLSSKPNKDNSLYGVLKHCHTKGGMRLLRANILQPMCSVKGIESRLDCVTELVKNPLLFFAIESAVTSFSNIEKLLSLCMHEPQQDGLRAAEYQLKYVLLLKTILEQLPTLVASLEEATSDYFCEVRENLGDVRYQIILSRILESVPANAKSVKGSVSAHLHACFAVKTGINTLLDVAKKTYCEIVQEIWDHVNNLREEFNIPLRMSFSAHRGFHIQYTPGPGDKNFNPYNEGKVFNLIQKSKSTFYFYTPDLVALDQRSQQVLNEVKLISNTIFCDLLNDIREHIGCLFNLCEYIAELDVITSFAHVSSGQNYVRPTFGDRLHITESRHPILDVIHDNKVVPNDIFAESGQNCVILTGPNQSGKSIYICQIALLQIMAQIGCYVPASSAKFRITDRLFSRLGLDDSVETNASTLIAEMRDVEYLRQNITASSLLIIDELCKGTSVDEGTSLAFTICEEFLDSTAFIFLTTHYIFLTKLEEMYYNVTNYYFESELVESGGKKTLKFSHKINRGITKAEQYGLQIAESTCFPSDVLSKAKEISQKLLFERKAFPEINGLSAKYKLAQQLRRKLLAGGSQRSSFEIETIVLRFKDLLLRLSPSSTEEEEMEKNQNIQVTVTNNTQHSPIYYKIPGNRATKNSESEICPLQIKKKRELTSRRDLNIKNNRLNQISRTIKKKYRLIMIQRIRYKTIRKKFARIRKNKNNSKTSFFFNDILSIVHPYTSESSQRRDVLF